MFLEAGKGNLFNVGIGIFASGYFDDQLEWDPPLVFDLSTHIFDHAPCEAMKSSLFILAIFSIYSVILGSIMLIMILNYYSFDFLHSHYFQYVQCVLVYVSCWVD